jgi:hypothetical protein
MAYINKTISCLHILRKLSKLFKNSSSEWVNESVENIGWAMQAIGYHAGFVDKTTQHDEPIIIKNNRALLPCDLERLTVVEVYEDSLTSGIVYIDAFGNPIVNTDEATKASRRTIRLYQGTDQTLAGITKESPRTSRVRPNTPYYILNDNFIVTSFSDGELKLHYRAFPTDDNGFPMILDDFNYKTCIENYLIKELIAEGYKHPVFSYTDAMQLFDRYLPKAQNSVKMPSIDGMKAFESSFKRLTTGLSSYESYFMNNEQETIIER